MPNPQQPVRSADMSAVIENLKLQAGETAVEKAAAMAIISAMEEEIADLKARLQEQT